jgi:tripartite-type tricarboxylate transporter receptor subunit TctC
MTSRTATLGGSAALMITATCFGLPAVSAADFPTKPLRLLVGFAPGGGADIVARLLGPKLTEVLGQQVIVDNRPGAGGNIATALLAKAEPDGHTLMLGSLGQLAINPTLYGSLPFDVSRDLAPVTRVTDATNILCLNPTLAVTDVRELIVLSKTRSLNGGSSGIGSVAHLALELFNSMTGTKIVHVPYKSGGQAMVELVAGEVQVVFSNPAAAMAQVKAGRVKALAVTTAKRLDLMPELPTVAESGVPGFEANNWVGLVVPARTPRSRIDRLNADVRAILGASELRKLLYGLALEAHPSTPEEFADYIRSETLKWSQVVKSSGAKPE